MTTIFVYEPITLDDPGNWTEDNTVECVGAGGDGAPSPTAPMGAGAGAGGDYAVAHNVVPTWPVEVNPGGKSVWEADGPPARFGPAAAPYCAAYPGRPGTANMMSPTGPPPPHPAGNLGGFAHQSQSSAGGTFHGGGGGGGGAGGPHGPGGYERVTPTPQTHIGNAADGGQTPAQTTWSAAGNSGTQWDNIHGIGGGGAGGLSPDAGGLGNGGDGGYFGGGGGGYGKYQNNPVFPASGVGAPPLVVVTWVPPARGFAIIMG